MLVMTFDPWDSYYMREAIKEAEIAFSKGEVPIGAVIVIAGQIVARAHNQVEQLADPTAHAEMLALTSATHHVGSKYLGAATLYVTIEPCGMCAGALSWARVGRVVYGAREEKAGYHLYSEKLLHPKTVITQGVLAEECATLMQRFFRSRRKIRKR